MLTSTSRFRIREEEVAAKVIEGEAIIINLATGVYYSLTGTGGEAWAMIEAGRTLSEIAACFSQRYAIPASQAHGDVERLVAQLVDEQLVEVASVAEAAGTGGAAASGNGSPATEAEAAPGPYAAPALESYRDMADLLALDPPMPGLQATAWQAPAKDLAPGDRP